MPFLQTAPVLTNQYLEDRVLRSYLRRVLPPAVLSAIEGDLTELGEFASTAWTQARTRVLSRSIHDYLRPVKELALAFRSSRPYTL